MPLLNFNKTEHRCYGAAAAQHLVLVREVVLRNDRPQTPANVSDFYADVHKPVSTSLEDALTHLEARQPKGFVMRFALFPVISATVLLLLGVNAPANDWNRLTTVVFEEPVQVPGTVLTPGIYLFKLAELIGEHNIVQIWSADQTILYATVFGSPGQKR